MRNKILAVASRRGLHQVVRRGSPNIHSGFNSFAAAVVAFCLMLAAIRATAQTQVLVDPSKPWGGFMNVFSLPADGGGYQFGSGWGGADLRAVFSGDLLT